MTVIILVKIIKHARPLICIKFPWVNSKLKKKHVRLNIVNGRVTVINLTTSIFAVLLWYIFSTQYICHVVPSQNQMNVLDWWCAMQRSSREITYNLGRSRPMRTVTTRSSPEYVEEKRITKLTKVTSISM